jgi:hypothetical protein
MNIECHYRFDHAQLGSPLVGEGFIRAKVKLTKPGVFSYVNQDGSIQREAKLPESNLQLVRDRVFER